MNKKIVDHFKKVDPILHSVIEKVGVLGPKISDDYFLELCEIIINQQLSDKAAATIFARFKKLFPQEKITADKLLKIPDQKIREAGISFSKIHYIKGIAEKITNKELNLNRSEERRVGKEC